MTISLAAFALRCEAMQHDLEKALPEVVARACQIVAEKARSLIGHEQPFWPPLAESTVARKGSSAPLLETGALQGSIEWNASDLEGYVGTNDPKAVWQEFGTSRGIPPRPFLGPALFQSETAIEKMAARAVMSVLNGLGGFSGELGEILHDLHLLHSLAHKIADDVSKMIHRDEQERARER